MDVSTNFKRAIVRKIKRDADAANITFLAKLQSYADAQVTRTMSGYVIQATAGNGHSTTLHIPLAGARDLSPAGITELFGVLQDDYEDAQAALVAAGTPEPSDGDIYTQMLSDMRAVSSYTSNWMYLAK